MKRFNLIFLLFFSLSLLACSDEPNSEKVRADLIGRSVGSPPLVWNILSLEEVETFAIKKARRFGLIVEYEVAVTLKDPAGPKAVAELFMVYRKDSNHQWELVVLTDRGSLHLVQR